MDAATISAIAQVVDAIPDGPYIVVESPFPALERIGGGDVNLGSTFGDINLPFGEDFLDVHTKDDNSTHVSDITDVNTGNGIVTDSIDVPKPETPKPETPATPETSGGNAAETAENTGASKPAEGADAAKPSEAAAATQAAQAAAPAEAAEAAQAATPAEAAEAAKPAEAATPAEAAQAATPAEAAEDAVAATPAEPAESPASRLFPKLFFA
ncbi:hypothetical protein ACFORJ_04020 [Corynebacterium hansenii]|uniref:Uncharacterized protein n=1 Tax=Corynebacterium hansenii TaxID=394964 RepID=A0ABV7ZMH0_9CORY|nr:hypothetical protein [Corynebacterium hansenii]WJY98834.1 hypothetical protein CHAN_00985 [Corynebacterium hansenii]